jgi:hypothetical protein
MRAKVSRLEGTFRFLDVVVRRTDSCSLIDELESLEDLYTW